MRTIHTLQQAGPDKALHLTIPVEEANRRYQVVIVIEPEPVAGPPPPEARGWPPGFFEQTAGRWQGDFVCEPEGEFEDREPL
jgi:hypothetical protein